MAASTLRSCSIRPRTAYDRGARRNPLRRIGVAKSFTQIVDTVRDRLTLASRLFEVATKLVVEQPNEPLHKTERRERGSQVVALLASSLNMISSEPLFIPLLKEAMVRAEFKQTRGKKAAKCNGKLALAPTNVNASRRTSMGDIADEAEAAAPVQESTSSLHGRHWGRGVPTRVPLTDEKYLQDWID